MHQDGWKFWIDRGGTFTDVVARRPDGTFLTRKLLSDNPDQYPDAATAGIRMILDVGVDAELPADRLTEVRLGTTVATNALLERAGARTVLITTSGFADALRIGYQDRPEIFRRHIRLPEPLYDRVIEISERMDSGGRPLRPLELDDLRRQLQLARADGYQAVAINLMHAHRNADHEERVATLAAELGFDQISASHEVTGLARFVPRGQTTVIDAYLTPVVQRYVRQISSELRAAELPDHNLLFMQSHGGLTETGRFRGRNAILSGPAGGIVGMAKSAARIGHHQVIGFDMGGTSTDVSHFAGDLERVHTSMVEGYRLQSPMLDLHTVAAGGGSILHFDGTRYRVGPDSAGSDPGPACYRRNGPLTVTDANLMLGRILPEHLPHAFGPDGDQPVDPDVVRNAFAGLADKITNASGDRRTPEQVAAGFLDIAVQNMANAVKNISLRKGRDVTRYALVCFGGAGGQHACAVADALGVRTVIVPPYAGVLSAIGIGLADRTVVAERAVELPLSEQTVGDLDRIVEELRADAIADLDPRANHNHQADHDQQADHDERVGRDQRAVARALLRYAGTDSVITIPYGAPKIMAAEFERLHRSRYSFLLDQPLVVEAIQVEAIAAAESDLAPPAPTEPAPETSTVTAYVSERWQEIAHHDRRHLTAGTRIDGPAVITEPDTTILIDDGWSGEADPEGHLVLHRTVAAQSIETGKAPDPVLLEVFNNLFMAIAEHMGARLQSTARSVNIKERVDFSCAIFDRFGYLIANAPHIPVHLGSMGSTVREVIKNRTGSMRPGDSYAINDPYHGGTHLPDVTVVSPVFDRSGQDLLFFVASRGHHAEIGGIAPGSMPANSRTIDDEGILFTDWLLVTEGRFRTDETRAKLSEAPYPSRDPDTNLADLRAQVAANAHGVAELLDLADGYGLEVVLAYLDHVQDMAEALVRDAIGRLSDGDFRYRMDCGAEIVVRVTVDHEDRSATVDFTGTSDQLPSNYNAPAAVVTAAVLYVFRTLIDADIPLNDGCLRPIRIVLEDGSFLSPRFPAAVVAGNVETSQAITGALYGALGIQAEGAGTMNNVTFGTDRVQYYETIGSGSGAGDGFDGASGVQTHMTNSRLTDPEILESRVPVIVESHRYRAGSGGAGRWRGGDGLIRRLRFTEPVRVSLLTGTRTVAPYGMAGGKPGSPGRNLIQRAAGEVEELDYCATADLATDDELIIETPGGGGYGEPPPPAGEGV